MDNHDTRDIVPKKTSRGLLVYHGTDNLGDEIQSIAARRFLGEYDYLIDREEFGAFAADATDEVVKVITNGWFCHHPSNFAPNGSVNPLLVSMHVTPNAQYRFSEDDVRNFLNRFGPVGARDYFTRDFFHSIGVDSYFSGCLTLTLERPPAPHLEYVVLNDVPELVVDKVRHSTSRNILLTKHSGHQEYSPKVRLKKAETLLSTYASAHAVITTRLHCAMPCVAMEIPVLLLKTAPDQERFEGLTDLVNNCTLDEFLSGASSWHVETPPPNPGRHAILRQNLKRRVKNFVAL